MTLLTLDDIRKLPKAELHCHLDGSLPIMTLIQQAREAHIKLPSDDLVELAACFGKKWTSLEECLEIFNLTTSVMQTYRSLVRVSWDLVRAAWHDKVTHLEVRFAPHLHTRKGLTNESVLDAVFMGLRGASSTWGPKPNVIICGIRNMSPDISLEMAKLAVANKDKGVVGFDIAGAEAGFPASLHADAIRVAKDGGLGLTIHAGEAAGPDAIREALDLGADRIGHGCRLIEDAQLLATVVTKGIPIECCVSSNMQTGACSDITSHPIKEMLRAGARVTVNTDNTLVHDTTLSRELLICSEQVGLTDDEVKQVISNGFAAKFANHATSQR